MNYKIMNKISVYYFLFILTFLGQSLSAIAQNSVNEDSENNTPQTNLETESKDSNSATISTSASSLGDQVLWIQNSVDFLC